jgi:hypothetical protein
MNRYERASAEKADIIGVDLGRIDIQRIQIIALARWRAARKWMARRS